MRGENFFEKLNNLGNLNMEKILFEAFYPVLFTCRDSSEDLYLCQCYDIRGSQKWIVARTNEDLVIKLLKDELTIFDAMNSPYDSNYLIELPDQLGEYKIIETHFSSIDEDDLPLKGEYLEAEEDEFVDYISDLSKKLKKNSSLTFKFYESKASIKEIIKPQLDQMTKMDKIRDFAIASATIKVSDNIVNLYGEIEKRYILKKSNPLGRVSNDFSEVKLTEEVYSLNSIQGYVEKVATFTSHAFSEHKSEFEEIDLGFIQYCNQEKCYGKTN